jgi:predicted ribosome quality control (RQC) complex YloA/Tae2 family protein
MVFFFESSEGYLMYMGRDKYENEDLIKYGLPEDLWFHVDDLSSAHVYLRLRKNQKLEEVSEATIMECAQLVKANSIEGCKLASVYVIYTRWRNLLKTANMEAGQVSYHDSSKVNRLKVEKNNAIVNKLNKTKQVSHVVLLPPYVC